jgi:DNA-directed RNA polymerase subunit beta
MGSNMQRQSVPLLYPEAPLIGTGLEGQTARDSGMTVLSSNYGKVVQVNEGKITIIDKEHNSFNYFLTKYQRSNQDTCINQRPIVEINEKVTTGQVIADGASTEGG